MLEHTPGWNLTKQQIDALVRHHKQIDQPTLSHDKERCAEWPCIACAEEFIRQVAQDWIYQHGPAARALLAKVEGRDA